MLIKEASIESNYVSYHVVAQVTDDTGAVFRLERSNSCGAYGACYDLLRWNGDLYVLLRKNVELVEALCYLEYIGANGSEYHAEQIEAFQIDTVMAS